MIRPHGLHGEVLVALSTDRPERSVVGASFVTRGGELVVRATRPHKDRHLMFFDGVVDRTGAEELRGTVLWAPTLEDDEVLWVHELIGATVIDQHGVERGSVISVIDNPAADLMELDSGALVPVNFVVGGPESDQVHVDVPDGLFEL